ncbi:MAG: hypothetical protein GEU26_12280 [Nitrososphaeraceae archaeon]|nr:hypothetical protein [Nitrososphaeraceae archaeon]
MPHKGYIPWNKGRKMDGHSKESIQKIKAARAGKKPNLDKQFTEEHKHKISLSCFKHWREYPRKKGR